MIGKLRESWKTLHMLVASVAAKIKDKLCPNTFQEQIKFHLAELYFIYPLIQSIAMNFQWRQDIQ